jgi:valine--pyruvate aminotransferase
VTDEVGAICVSRPTNPTGNVLTDDEIARLHASWRSTTDMPLIIDNAYGPPFPGILYK